MDAKSEYFLPTTTQTFRPTRRAPLGRRGSWKKRYVAIAALVAIWLVSHCISKSVILSRARLYEDLQKMMARRPAIVAGSENAINPSGTDYNLRMSNITKISMAYGNITEVYQRALGMSEIDFTPNLVNTDIYLRPSNAARRSPGI